mmetsp:Transcript_49941/g.165369  ORF Transcript_49941/g.165369 Transcript_49941/m.165369 type:complete len:203 (-) Transcript_49941:1272-1880(-)
MPGAGASRCCDGDAASSSSPGAARSSGCTTPSRRARRTAAVWETRRSSFSAWRLADASRSSHCLPASASAADERSASAAFRASSSFLLAGLRSDGLSDFRCSPRFRSRSETAAAWLASMVAASAMAASRQPRAIASNTAGPTRLSACERVASCARKEATASRRSACARPATEAISSATFARLSSRVGGSRAGLVICRSPFAP